MSFDQPAWLWGLPLALLPLLARTGQALVNAWAVQLPRDAASDVLQWALRGAAALAIAALLIALAGPHQPEATLARVGQGAEIVLVLDRSRSMDERFAGARPAGAAPKGTGPEALDYYARLRHMGSSDAKGKVARQVLSAFAAQRPVDRFGMIVFSTLPIQVLDFTQKAEVIQAAIAAANMGRGLAETDIGLALLQALALFDERVYTGSRLILLVSDGGDRIDPDAREQIARLARKHRVALYWIYLRTANSPGLMRADNEPPASIDSVPEYFLHRFFQSMGTPYRAYEADNPLALQEAIDAVSRLENLPINYLETVPRRELSPACWGLALACVLLLLGARRMEIKP